MYRVDIYRSIKSIGGLPTTLLICARMSPPEPFRIEFSSLFDLLKLRCRILVVCLTELEASSFISFVGDFPHQSQDRTTCATQSFPKLAFQYHRWALTL